MTEEVWVRQMDVINIVYLDVAHAALFVAIEEAKCITVQQIVFDVGHHRLERKGVAFPFVKSSILLRIRRPLSIVGSYPRLGCQSHGNVIWIDFHHPQKSDTSPCKCAVPSLGFDRLNSVS